MDENSATMQLPTELALPLAGSDHRSICKFGDADDERYEPIGDAIDELAKIALVGQYLFASNTVEWDMFLHRYLINTPILTGNNCQDHVIHINATFSTELLTSY